VPTALQVSFPGPEIEDLKYSPTSPVGEVLGIGFANGERFGGARSFTTGGGRDFGGANGLGSVMGRGGFCCRLRR
jgi:hypothetical protein